MATPPAPPPPIGDSLSALVACLDERAGLYRALRGAESVREYLATKDDRADEETLTELILREILHQVLGFPVDAVFEQLSRDGSKPDFTPIDLVAHPFVLDSKSSSTDLAHHEKQIRRYIDERSLTYGVLFNLREVRVYKAKTTGHDEELSFPLLPLWEHARQEALVSEDVLERFERFYGTFSWRKLGLAAKIGEIRNRPSWFERLSHGDVVEVDVEYVVERLRRLARMLQDDAGAQVDDLDRTLGYSDLRARRVLGELRSLAQDIAPGTKPESLPDTVDAWRHGDGLVGRVWRQYLLRVAYLTLARILLYRSWEDVAFVDEYLYDGGFGMWLDRHNQDVRKVLNEAFLHGGQEYRWLFGPDNNYDWYRPSDAALVELLYALVPVPLGRLDADVLGSLYESYADEIDRDRRGQFFTPRPVVRFMLDRAGFRGPDGVFRVEGDTRHPLQVLDFATGSGGFLVEAARRVIDVAAANPKDVKALHEGLAAVVQGFVGGEISPFPYYLTEINLLLQVSRLLGALRQATGRRESAIPALGVLHVDSLASKRKTNLQSLDGLSPEHRHDEGEIVASDEFDLVPLDGEKQETWRARMWQDGGFDLVVGNPPYVGEANNKPLFDLLRALDAWKGIYRGHTDYFYYFLLLALDKLRPGGRLCVIVPAGWMNAGAAGFLREQLARELTIDELFLFGSYRVFTSDGPAPTPTVESLILVARKGPPSEGHTIRVVALEDEGAHPPTLTELLAEMTNRAAGQPGRAGGIHVHDVPQAGLVADRPWPVKFAIDDLASRVVARLQGLLDDDAAPVEQLERAWKVFRGIETGADAYTRRIDKRLTAPQRSALRAAGAQFGDPILELPPGAELSPPWSDHPDLLVRAPEAHAILYGAIDPHDYASIVALGHGSPPQKVLDALERWKPLLASRAEISRNPHRHWWETAWRRNPSDMAAPKVIALYRTDRGRFALDEEGEWQPSTKMTIAIGRAGDAPVAYLCGLLNSELLDLWYAVRGKTPWHVRRNYEPLRMNEMPYHRPESDPRAESVADLVRAIGANRRALLPHRSVVRELGRIVKDPWRSGPMIVDTAALVRELAPAATVSVRIDAALTLAAPPAPARWERTSQDEIALIRGKARVGSVTGKAVRLDLLAEILSARVGPDVGELLLPKDVAAFRLAQAERRALVEGLLADGRALVEQVERLVCSIYGLPNELADEVVAHAVARAARGHRPDADTADEEAADPPE